MEDNKTAMSPVWSLFFDQKSVKKLDEAKSTKWGGTRNSFGYPYPYEKNEMNIMYRHIGQKAWSRPIGGCKLLFLVCRKNDDDKEKYTIWMVEKFEEKFKGERISISENWETNNTFEKCDGVSWEDACEWIKGRYSEWKNKN